MICRPSPPLAKKKPYSYFGWKWHSIIVLLKKMKNQYFAIFIFWGIIIQKSKNCIHLAKKQKRCSMFWNWFLSSWVFFVQSLVVEWLILYFTFIMHSQGFQQVLKSLCFSLWPLKVPSSLFFFVKNCPQVPFFFFERTSILSFENLFLRTWICRK